MTPLTNSTPAPPAARRAPASVALGKGKGAPEESLADAVAEELGRARARESASAATTTPGPGGVAWAEQPGRHCGGDAPMVIADTEVRGDAHLIAHLRYGAAAFLPYGWAPGGGGLGRCKAQCGRDPACQAFVWQRRARRCFWKGEAVWAPGSADRVVKVVFAPPEQLLTFCTVFMVPFGGHLPTLPSF